MFGCGYVDEYRGNATVGYTDGNPLIETKTCPQWLYKEDEFVQWILFNIEEYARGNLGQLWDMDADLVDYFQAAENETNRWNAAMQEQISSGD